jgi:hypothetical protein
MGGSFYIVETDPLEEARPEYYEADNEGSPLIIVNANDPRWRMPLCELRDMAKEIEAENRNNPKFQSQADRMRVMQDRILDHFEQMGLIARGATVNRPLRGR